MTRNVTFLKGSVHNINKFERYISESLYLTDGMHNAMIAEKEKRYTLMIGRK